MLHSRAGSREVVEVHGSIRTADCPGCLEVEEATAVLAQLEERPAPLCVRCGEILKPGVTLFGELLPAGAIERAMELARSAALMLVVGSTLEVWPVAGLPLEARSFAVVNRGPTALDPAAVARDRRGRRGDALERPRRAQPSFTAKRLVNLVPRAVKETAPRSVFPLAFPGGR